MTHTHGMFGCLEMSAAIPEKSKIIRISERLTVGSLEMLSLAWAVDARVLAQVPVVRMGFRIMPMRKIRTCPQLGTR